MTNLSDPRGTDGGDTADRGTRRGLPKWLLIGGAVVLVFCLVFAVASGVLASYARAKLQSILAERFDSDVQIQNLQLTLFPFVAVNGDSVVFRLKQQPGRPPLIEISKFTARGNILGLVARHLTSVRLEGLKITVPPKDPDRVKKPGGGSTPYFVIGEVIADGTVLTTLPRESWKEPLVFDVKRLHMHDVSSTSPLSFEALLTNAKPPGEITSTGKFGPWNRDEPGDTPVSGSYQFRNADLGVFKGIKGTLSSDGSYTGSVDHIEVAGHTDVPNFMLSEAGNPVHLVTDYKAVVDGTNGNTYLRPVTAHFGHSTVVARGSVEGKRGEKGKVVSLDAEVKDGRLEDMLQIAVRGKSPPLTGAISFHSKILIPTGDVDVVDKLKLDGAFVVGTAHFSKLNVQEKVNDLSHRGKGNADDADAPTVAANFQGKFQLDRAVLAVRDVSFQVPGVDVALHGTFGLRSQAVDFRGTAKLDAKVSQTTTGFKSLLLKAVDPLFKRKNSSAGAVIPIRISGQKDKPAIGLDLMPHGK